MGELKSIVHLNLHREFSAQIAAGKKRMETRFQFLRAA
jgi:hypothetical protein